MNKPFNDDLGQLYSLSNDGGSTWHPLSVWFSAAGQVCGVQAAVFGTSWKAGPAAPAGLVSKGYFRASQSQKNKWTINVSFRDAETIQSTTESPLVLGDRLVINQVREGTLFIVRPFFLTFGCPLRLECVIPFFSRIPLLSRSL